MQLMDLFKMGASLIEGNNDSATSGLDLGDITNALGDKKESTCWGKPSPWCDYSGDLKDLGWRGLTVFDHPDTVDFCF